MSRPLFSLLQLPWVSRGDVPEPLHAEVLAEHFTAQAHVYTEREARQARLRQAQSPLEQWTR